MSAPRQPENAQASHAPPYRDGWAELADRLACLQLSLRLAVERLRARRPRAHADPSQISDSEVDQFLHTLQFSLAPVSDAAPGEAPLRHWLHEYARQIPLHYAATPSTVRLPLRDLAARFELSPPEVDLFVLCFAPEIHPGYARVFAYLQEDPTRTRPTLNLALDLATAAWRDRLLLRRNFHESLPMFQRRLVHSVNGRFALDEPLHVDPAVLAHVLEALGTVAPRAAMPTNALALDDLILPEAPRAAVQQVGELLRRPAKTPWLISLHGPPHVGKRTVAESLAAHAGRRLAILTPTALENDDGKGRLVRWLRNARLHDEWPCFDASELAEDKADPAIVQAVELAAQERFGAFFVLSPTETRVHTPTGSLAALDIDFPVPPAPLRREAWRQSLDAASVRCEPADLEALARSFPLTAGQIRRACREALTNYGGGGAVLSKLRSASRSQLRHKLERLAQYVPPVHDWNDVVLPAEQLAQLREIAEAIRCRDQVLDAWQFGRKVSVSPGTSVLFFGPSGTGKTMSAGILASEIGMDLHRVDLSRVVSKYIGETEKNLEALFSEARRACTVLLFDEADALFGKRSEVRDAHDRYANIEVAYLLQRMESYDGVTVLATNLRKNIDAAFLRRLQFSVEFPAPNPELRLRIWKKVWPPGAPLAGDVDLDFLARQFDLSGGNIRNVALKAAYLAAQRAAPIGMAHLILAVRREFQKLGRLCVDDSFGEYRHLLPAREAP